MTSPFAGRFGMLQGTDGSLVLFLAKATLILICALGLTVVMRRAAAGARHIVWLVTLGGLLLVPALTFWGPLHLHILPARAAKAATSSQQSPGAKPALQRDRGPRADAGAAPRANPQRPRSDFAGVQKRFAPSDSWIGGHDPFVVLLGAWLAVALAIGLSLAYATLSLHVVVRASTPLNGAKWLNVVWEVSDRLGLPHAPRLRQSSAVKMPFACGVLHPTVILPAESEGWSAERRRAVLLHEFAHVRRRDLIGHTIGRLACAVYWFHPLVWTASKRLRSESERACDDLALICGTRAADYAEHLLDIVTSVRHDRTPMVALAMARKTEFEGRMLAILDPQLKRATPSRGKSSAMVGSLTVLAIVVGAASPVPRTALTVASAGAAPLTVGSVAAVGGRSAVPASETPIDVVSVVGGNGLAAVTSRIGEGRADTAGKRNVRVPTTRPVTKDGVSFDANSATLERASQAPNRDDRAELLAKILRSDSSASIRRTAAWGLQRYAADVPDASSALVWSLQRDADAAVREMSAWALASGKDGDANVNAALSSALRSDPSESVRETSAWSLAHVGDGSNSAIVLTSALSDRNADVRAVSAWALGNFQLKSAPAALIADLQDADPKVRAATAWALHNIADESSIPALQAALRGETNTNLQIDYVRALGSMGDASVGALRTLLVSPDERVKSIAVDALAGGRAMGPWPWPMPRPRPRP